MSDAKSSAEAILDELQIDDPSLLKHLVEICIERGAFVRQAHLHGADARLTVRGPTGIITIKPQPKYKTRARFSIAHELGHFEMHRKQKMLLSCQQKDLFEGVAAERSRTREGEANDFASELLMPERFIKPMIVQSEPSIDLIQDLAKKFETSLFATVKRFVQLTPRDCIAVFFNAERIQYAWPSRGLMEGQIPLVRKLRENSHAWKIAHGKSRARSASSPQAIEPSAWFNTGVAEASDGFENPENFGQWAESARFFPQLGLGVSILLRQ